MTKREAIAEFKAWIESGLAEINTMDKPMLRQAWNDYTDSLCKTGRITEKQYDTWTSPIK